MRKEKTIILNNKEYVLREKSQREIKEILQGLINIGPEMAGKPWYEAILSQIPKLVGIPYEEWLDFTPSETKELLTTFKDVNAVFFEIPDLLVYLGLKEAVNQFKNMLKSQIEAISNAISQALVQQLEPAKSPNQATASDSQEKKETITESSLQSEPMPSEPSQPILTTVAPS